MVQWQYVYCDHHILINDFGNCRCIHSCKPDAFIGQHRFHCNKVTHKFGYTGYAASDFLTVIALLMDGANVADLDQAVKVRFMANLTM